MFDVFYTATPNISSSSENISKYIWPVFPQTIFLFLIDYGARDLDEYFHFYNSTGQKFKMKEIFFKKFKYLHAIIIVCSCFVASYENSCFCLVVIKISVKVLGSAWVPYQEMFFFGYPASLYVYCWLVHTFESFLTVCKWEGSNTHSLISF